MSKSKPTTARPAAKAKAEAAPAKPPRQRAPNTGVAFVPTDEQRNLVRLCMAIGYTQEQTARLIGPGGITVDTLAKHFRPELDRGAEQVLARVAANLVSIASDRNHPKAVTAAIFILKARGGWRDHEKVAVELPGDAAEKAAAGGPIEFTIKIGDATPKD